MKSMKVIQVIPAAMILLLFAGSIALSGNYQDIRIDSVKAPEWISGKLDSGLYIGISPNSVSEDEAIEKALNNARTQIVQSLGVKISAESIDVSKQELTDGKLNESATINQKAILTSNNIIKVTPEKTYREHWKRIQDGSESIYWRAYVLVRFSKTEHDMYIEKLAQQSVTQIQKFTANAEELMTGGNIEAALKAFGQAAIPGRELEDFTGISPDLVGAVKDARQRAAEKAQKHLSLLSIQLNSPQVSKLRKDILESVITFHVKYGDQPPIPAKNLKINARFIEGQGEIEPISTDNDGIGQIHLKSLKGHDAQYAIELTPEAFSSMALAQLKLPSATIRLLPRPGAILITISPTNMAIKATQDGISSLQAVLIKRGYIILTEVSKKQKPDYILKMSFESGGELLIAEFAFSTNDGVSLWNWRFPDSRFKSVSPLLYEWVAGNIEKKT